MNPRGRRSKGKGSLSSAEAPAGYPDENSNYFSFSQPPCDTKGPLRRKEGSGGGGGGGGSAVVPGIHLGLPEYKSCTDHPYLTAPA